MRGRSRALTALGILSILCGTLAGCGRNDGRRPSSAPSAAASSENPPENHPPESASGNHANGAPAPAPAAERHALLIACSKYDHLPPSAELRGPGNDVELMRELLVERFAFPEDNITVLAEGTGRDADRPLRANIERAFDSLADRVRDGSQVVVFYSGHGSQQPDDDPEDPEDPEPDGLDEILLAADVMPEFDLDAGGVRNAVRDDDLRGWLHAIRSRGASVWVVIDACHSGTAIRGTEVARQLPPEMLVPRETLRAAGRRTARSRAAAVERSSLDADKGLGGIVAIYAAQPHEPTFELPLPVDSDDRRWQGLLTYVLVQVLTQSEEPLSYAELVQRIHQEYVSSLGRLGPTPLVEGRDRNKEVLGAAEIAGRSRLILQIDERGRYSLRSGRLHGLSEGTILAVYPPPGTRAADEPLGHVRVHRSRMADADLVPCAFARTAARLDLPPGGRCRIVHRDYGEMRLRVAFDPAGGDDAMSQTAALKSQIEARADRSDGVFTLVDDPGTAQWIIRPTDDRRVVLLPAHGWSRRPGERSSHLFGPVPVDARTGEWLDDRLNRIARATHLLRIAGETTRRARRSPSARSPHNQTDLQVELLKLESEEDDDGRPIGWDAGGIRLREGDLVSVRLHNTSRHAVDFTLLFIDSGYGIEPIYPAPDTVVDNRLGPGASFTVGPLMVEGDSLGLEHLLVIALKADGAPVDFTWLAQDSIERARAAGPGGNRTLNSPLGQLLQHAMFAHGRTRGLRVVDSDSGFVRVISWRTDRG